MLNLNTGSAKEWKSLNFRKTQFSNPKFFTMQTRLLMLFGALITIGFWACEPATPPSTDTGGTSVPKVSIAAKDTISIDTATKWYADWIDRIDTSSLQSKPIYGYVMPKVDLTEVLAEKAVSARFYLGLDGNTYKLMLVGVDSSGNDM